MSKRHMDIRIDEVEPVGPITDATAPWPVRVEVMWTIDLKWIWLEEAWAMAWTTNEVLIYYRQKQTPRAMTFWVRAEKVQRR